MKPLVLTLLAAGASRRMRGADKLLEQVAGEALLRRQARAMLGARAGPVLVTLPPDRPDRAAVLQGLALGLLPVPKAAEGLSASLRAAARVALDDPRRPGLLIAPADMPDLTAGDFAAAAAAFDGIHPLRATGEGMPGHPVIFPHARLPDLLHLTGDSGARAVLAAHPPMPLPLPGRHALTDLDTPEDWAVWRAANGA